MRPVHQEGVGDADKVEGSVAAHVEDYEGVHELDGEEAAIEFFEAVAVLEDADDEAGETVADCADGAKYGEELI